MKWKVVLPIVVIFTLFKISGGATFIYLAQTNLRLELLCICFIIVAAIVILSILMLVFPKTWREIKAYCKKILIHEIGTIQRFFHTLNKRVKSTSIFLRH